MNRDSWVSLIDALLHWSQRPRSDEPPPLKQPKKVDWEVVPFDFSNVGQEASKAAKPKKKVVKRKVAAKA